MALFDRWTGAVVALSSVLFPWVSMKAAPAAQANPLESDGDAIAPLTLSQNNACPESWQTRKTYARVATQSNPLRVRATPGGQVIGSIPKGWVVVVLEKSGNGEWTKVTSHYGDLGDYGFGSAPDFRTGWVASRYLQPLGDFCEKPMALAGTQLIAAAAAPTFLVQEDWLALGDRIAQSRHT